MQIPRRQHSSCSLGEFFYVFAGENKTGLINSIEVISANDVIENRNDLQWELIEVSREIF